MSSGADDESRLTNGMTDFLRTTLDTPIARLLLAHGAGAAMDSPFLEQMAALLGQRGIETWRFEFPYMAARRTGAKKRPPPKAETLLDDFRRAVAECRLEGADVPLLIGGKSMGGRVASMLGDELFSARMVEGCICLGYPFHPPNQPQTWRTAHLKSIRAPLLVVQGERDPFGTKTEIDGLIARKEIAASIRFAWIGDGDHDLGPRGASGFTKKGNLAAAADAIAEFARTLTNA